MRSRAARSWAEREEAWVARAVFVVSWARRAVVVVVREGWVVVGFVRRAERRAGEERRAVRSGLLAGVRWLVRKGKGRGVGCVRFVEEDLREPVRLRL